jgi:hypothetical protein
VGTTETDLSRDIPPGSSVVYSILVSGDTVHASGTRDDGSIEVPCSWADSLRTDFPDTAKGAKINSTFLKQ